jgi:drug/metabolite transporter (DMT)-like permease
MTSLAFTLILFSSLMHALYNLLIKQSRNKTVFIWWMFVTSTGLFTLTLPMLPGPFPRPGFVVLFLGSGGALCFVLYHLFIGRGELSVTYPLSQTGMLYVPFWGVLLLGEHLSVTGCLGIFFVVAGGYLVQLQRLTIAGLYRPISSLVNHSVQAALAAGFVYSLGAIIDKTGVDHYSPLHFTYILVVAMLALMTANIMRPRYHGRIFAEWRENRMLIVASGPLMMGSFLSFRYGLALAPLSYAVTVRQVSVLFGVLFGIIFLGEACGRIRIMAAALILAGVCCIRLG